MLKDRLYFKIVDIFLPLTELDTGGIKSCFSNDNFKLFSILFFFFFGYESKSNFERL